MHIIISLLKNQVAFAMYHLLLTSELLPMISLVYVMDAISSSPGKLTMFLVSLASIDDINIHLIIILCIFLSLQVCKTKPKDAGPQYEVGRRHNCE